MKPSAVFNWLNQLTPGQALVSSYALAILIDKTMDIDKALVKK